MKPWETNCPHIDKGWCPDCVKQLGKDVETLAVTLTAIKQIMKGPAGNMRFMQIAGPARQTLTLIKGVLPE